MDKGYRRAHHIIYHRKPLDDELAVSLSEVNYVSSLRPSDVYLRCHFISATAAATRLPK